MKGKKKSEINPNAFDTLIGKNAIITGKLESSGLTRVEGKIFGDVYLDGNLIVGADSLIEGNIHATNVEIFGKVTGNIEAKDSLTLHETAKLVGDVDIKTLIVKNNASFAGNCKMKTSNDNGNDKKDKIEKKDKKKK